MKIDRKIDVMAKETQFQVHSRFSRFSRAISHSRYIPGFPGPKLMDSRYILHENHGEIKVLYLIEIESTGKSIYMPSLGTDILTDC